MNEPVTFAFASHSVSVQKPLLCTESVPVAAPHSCSKDKSATMRQLALFIFLVIMLIVMSQRKHAHLITPLLQIYTWGLV